MVTIDTQAFAAMWLLIGLFFGIILTGMIAFAVTRK